jgi:hypothetical protein
MAKKKVPWRTVIHSKETGRFTEQQIRDAVRAVKERNAARGKSASRRSAGTTGDAPRQSTAGRVDER